MRYPSPTEIVYLEAQSRYGASFLAWLNDRSRENEAAYLDALTVLETTARVARQRRRGVFLPPENMHDVPPPVPVI